MQMNLVVNNTSYFFFLIIIMHKTALLRPFLCIPRRLKQASLKSFVHQKVERNKLHYSAIDSWKVLQLTFFSSITMRKRLIMYQPQDFLIKDLIRAKCAKMKFDTGAIFWVLSPLSLKWGRFSPSSYLLGTVHNEIAALFFLVDGKMGVKKWTPYVGPSAKKKQPKNLRKEFRIK